MYRAAFKYNPAKVTDNKAYPWPTRPDKYALDRKMLNEDTTYSLQDRSLEQKWKKLKTEEKERFVARDGGKRIGWAQGVSLGQLFSDYATTGAIPMRVHTNNSVIWEAPTGQQTITNVINSTTPMKVQVPIGQNPRSGSKKGSLFSSFAQGTASLLSRGVGVLLDTASAVVGGEDDTVEVKASDGGAEEKESYTMMSKSERIAYEKAKANEYHRIQKEKEAQDKRKYGTLAFAQSHSLPAQLEASGAPIPPKKSGRKKEVDDLLLTGVSLSDEVDILRKRGNISYNRLSDLLKATGIESTAYDPVDTEVTTRYRNLHTEIKRKIEGVISRGKQRLTSVEVKAEEATFRHLKDRLGVLTGQMEQRIKFHENQTLAARSDTTSQAQAKADPDTRPQSELKGEGQPGDRRATLPPMPPGDEEKLLDEIRRRHSALTPAEIKEAKERMEQAKKKGGFFPWSNSVSAASTPAGSKPSSPREEEDYLFNEGGADLNVGGSID